MYRPAAHDVMGFHVQTPLQVTGRWVLGGWSPRSGCESRSEAVISLVIHLSVTPGLRQWCPLVSQHSVHSLQVSYN